MTVLQLKPLLCVLVFLAMPLTSFGQTIPFLDQTFDFEDLSTAGFTSGIEGPVVVTDSIGNNVLQLQTSGAPSGAGSVLVALNNTLTGDFSDAGSIQFDATNPNLTDLNVRFSFSSPGNVFISDDVVLAPGASESLFFELDPSGFAQPSGAASFEESLANVSQIRILNNPNVALGGGAGLAQGAPVFDLDGNTVVGTLLVDNFVVSSAAAPAVAVPEPGCVSLLLGLAGAMAARRRKRS